MMLLAEFESPTVRIRYAAECLPGEYTFTQTGTMCEVIGECHDIMMLIGIVAARGEDSLRSVTGDA